MRLSDSATIIDLCSGSGAWSEPYAEAGYNVLRIDLPQDVRLVRRRRDLTVRGILAAPPCRVLSSAGNRIERSRSELLDALSVVDACIRLIYAYNPVWWALENPVGDLVHYLGPAKAIFQPWQYGEGYSKRTCLWGKFEMPSPTHAKPGYCPSISDVVRNPATRATTPGGFARAFFEANR